jgi:hypothetical protein
MVSVQPVSLEGLSKSLPERFLCKVTPEYGEFNGQNAEILP